ncbi:DUF3105 domain-containing protein [Cryptosporangium minutisporangium]|uniref:DUF3105 domain-containing protein n=1 Tax=Cryptosporangium minutisporangium TaxID=113569 RepID=A0ABP6T1I9_9ACTN
MSSTSPGESPPHGEVPPAPDGTPGYPPPGYPPNAPPGGYPSSGYPPPTGFPPPGGFPPPTGFPPPGGFPPPAGFPPPGGAKPPRSNGKLVAGIVIGVVLVLLVCGGIVTTTVLVLNNSPSTSTATTIDGVVDYRKTQPEILTTKHVDSAPGYPVTPPVGGDHNTQWQNCQGDVYAAKIDDTRAVHSLEHGAVWITYRPGLPADQLEALKRRVVGKNYTMLSPYPTLDQAISLQAWGYQLKVDDADDERIDEFLTKYRMSASIESGAPCSNGSTATD